MELFKSFSYILPPKMANIDYFSQKNSDGVRHYFWGCYIISVLENMSKGKIVHT